MGNDIVANDTARLVTDLAAIRIARLLGNGVSLAQLRAGVEQDLAPARERRAAETIGQQMWWNADVRLHAGELLHVPTSAIDEAIELTHGQPLHAFLATAGDLEVLRRWNLSIKGPR